MARLPKKQSSPWAEHRCKAIIRLGAIRKNLSLLSGLARNGYDQFHGAVPMVKANAYGHGSIEVSSFIERHRDTLAFGVATIGEAIELRESGIRKPIWVFSESAPWNEDLHRGFEKFKLTPVFHSLEDFKVFFKICQRRSGFGEYQIKFNSGLNRLGADSSDVGEFFKLASKLSPKKAQCDGLLSHLASSESPHDTQTKMQVRYFREIVRSFSRLNPRYVHFANTAGVENNSDLGIGKFCNVIRPGIGLYGYGSSKKLEPALLWQARVLRQRRLRPGETVGYGASFQADAPTNAVTISIGYGDGFFRALSNKPLLVGVGSRLEDAAVLGRVSMDLTVLNLPGRLKVGDWVTLLGKEIAQAQRMAEAASTIVYELLTAISRRVPRVY